MGNYSAEEIAAFKRKDLLYSRQSAAKATSVVFEGMGISIEEFKKYSDEMFAWIQEGNPPTPTPTTDQQKVLDAIGDCIGSALDQKELYKKVLQYSTEVAGAASRTYPQCMDSVPGIVKWLENN